MFKRKFTVTTNSQGLLYKDGKFQQVLDTGVYKYFDFKRKLSMVLISTATQYEYVTGQEALSEDKIAFRFSFFFVYKVTDVLKYAECFDVTSIYAYASGDAKQVMHRKTQVFLRSKIGSLKSDEIATNDKKLFQADDELKDEFKGYGLELVDLMVVDISFPKRIQDLFSKHLEAQQRAKADIEIARTAVATARALKNASKIIEGDEQVRFTQTLEALTKIAENGKSTFVIGDAGNGALRI